MAYSQWSCQSVNDLVRLGDQHDEEPEDTASVRALVRGHLYVLRAVAAGGEELRVQPPPTRASGSPTL